MPQLIIFWVLLTVFLLLAPLREQEPPENARKLIQFQANGLPFTGILGNYFLMHDDKTQIEIGLLSAETPFSLSKGNEKVAFDFEVKKETDYIFDFHVSFEEKYRYEVLKLTGDDTRLKCTEYGIPLSFYIKITKKGQKVPIFEKIESKTCFSGTGHDFMYNQSLISKRIATIKLSPGKYNVYIKNMFPVQEYNAYNISLEISMF